MKPLLITIVSLSFTIAAFGQTDSSLHKKRDTIYTYTTLVPLKCQVPTIVSHKVDSSTLFVVELREKGYCVWYDSKPIKLKNLNQLDSFIKKNISGIQKKNTTLRCSQKQPYSRLKEVTDLFNTYKIEHFNLTTTD
jgi:hypothetical protein